MLGSPMKRTFALGITLTACASGAGPRTTSSESVIAIVNAMAIPVDTERVIANATIIIRGDRIVWVGASRDAAIPAEANRADARGAFVLPGLQHELVHMDQILRAFIYRDTVGWRPRLDSLARAIAAAGAWLNPTLAVEELLARAGTATYAAHLERPEMRPSTRRRSPGRYGPAKSRNGGRLQCT